MNNKGPRQSGITIKSKRELKLMVEAGQIVACAKAKVTEAAAPGVETRDLGAIAENEIRQLVAIPSFKGYQAGATVPFPASIC
ncbi:MAG: type I methionyl aminopeptidase, partial [Chloroflexi bacterium]|nr:type I methionyl aminopeptidase [Chloroflexota bacterium]